MKLMQALVELEEREDGRSLSNDNSFIAKQYEALFQKNNELSSHEESKVGLN